VSADPTAIVDSLFVSRVRSSFSHLFTLLCRSFPPLIVSFLGNARPPAPFFKSSDREMEAETTKLPRTNPNNINIIHPNVFIIHFVSSI